ncbi:hypothetical protein [Paenibacillus motobuensis]|uniref:Transposase n=1 Tax=Paenibacillus motobuensis TaxID=295324 RepID=A0ABN0Y456_9BACL
MQIYRDELDALNAIYVEQCKTNELLQRLVDLKESGSVASKGRGRGNTRKGAELPVAAVDSEEDNSSQGSTT